MSIAAPAGGTPVTRSGSEYRSLVNYNEHDEEIFSSLVEAPVIMTASNTSQVVECTQCGTVSFRQGWAAEAKMSKQVWISYPERRREPLPVAKTLPPPIARLYHETIEAVHAKTLTLAAAGMRAIVEGVCAEQQCGGKSLEEKIAALKKAGSITITQAKGLHAHRVIGNSALHKLDTPSEQEILDALTMLEE